jgi:hypothetical protein
MPNGIYDSVVKKERPVPSCCISTTLSAAVSIAEVVNCIIGRTRPVYAPEVLHIDLVERIFRKINLCETNPPTISHG